MGNTVLSEFLGNKPKVVKSLPQATGNQGWCLSKDIKCLVTNKEDYSREGVCEWDSLCGQHGWSIVARETALLGGGSVLSPLCPFVLFKNLILVFYVYMYLSA